MSLHQQGANKGAVTSFLISTPESGVDSIAITYALLDPVMTVVRPVAAFLTAFAAGVAENLTGPESASPLPAAFPTGPSNEGNGPRAAGGCEPRRRPFSAKLFEELRFAFTDFWGGLAGAFFLGVLLAGTISALMPESFLTLYLGGGITAMLIMLAAGIPLYICATASTPIAAALILKGVSPGAVLVFLLVGPATNAAAVAVVLRTLGRRSTAIYLGTIAVCALLFGVLVDRFYAVFGLSARAVVGNAAETIPHGLALASAVILVLLTLWTLWPKRPWTARATDSPPAAARKTGVSILPKPGAAEARPPERST